MTILKKHPTSGVRCAPLMTPKSGNFIFSEAYPSWLIGICKKKLQRKAFLCNFEVVSQKKISPLSRCFGLLTLRCAKYIFTIVPYYLQLNNLLLASHYLATIKQMNIYHKIFLKVVLFLTVWFKGVLKKFPGVQKTWVFKGIFFNSFSLKVNLGGGGDQVTAFLG